MIINEQKTVSAKTSAELDKKVNEASEKEGWTPSNNLTIGGGMFHQQMYRTKEVPDIKKPIEFPEDNVDETTI